MKNLGIPTAIATCMIILMVCIIAIIYPPGQHPQKPLFIEQYIVVHSQNYKAITDILNEYGREGYKLKIVIPGIGGQVIYLVKEIKVYKYVDNKRP